LFSTCTTGAQQEAAKKKNKISVRKTTKFKASSKTITNKIKKIVDPEIKAVGCIWRHFKRCSGGADGGVVGINGSLRPTSLMRILRVLKVKNCDVLDLGAGDGRVLYAAMAGGADNALGFELPENKAHKFVFDAVNKMLHSDTTSILSTCTVAWSKAEWSPRDIDCMRRIPANSRRTPGNSQRVYTFWVGMPLKTQLRILTLCAQSPTVRAIAVFRDRKWPNPDAGQPATCASILPFNFPLAFESHFLFNALAHACFPFQRSSKL
jgi:hypothetical protein